MLRLCICLLAVWFVGCQCPVSEEKQAVVNETAPDSRLAEEVPVQPSGTPTGAAPDTDTKPVSPAVQQEQLADIQWVTSFAEGLKIAKSRNCPLMVDFFAHWCGWCVKLDEETWTNKDVILLSQGFVCVKIDCDQDRQTPARYGARGLPTILFINPDEKVIHRVVGYRNAEDMIAEMKKAL